MFEVPDVVRRKALAAGDGEWLDRLPMLVAELERAWSVTTGAVIAGGTEALVLEATRADRTPAVLKILVPRDFDAARDEITVYRLVDGDGCASLFEADPERGALLLERLGRSLHELQLPLGRRHEILCAAVQRIWRPAADSGLRTGADKGRWLIDTLTRRWEQLARPCSERAVAYAVWCAERRIAAHDDERAVLVHGDVHQWNALESPDGFKLIDPDGLLAEPEYDLGVMMREDPVELMAGDPWDRACRLAALTGLDATATWEWGVVERVSTGLLCVEVGLQPVGGQMLEAADAIASSYG